MTQALAGGAIIGLAVSLFFLASGRVAGISGILGGLLARRPGDWGWRVAFVAGLIVAGVGATLFAPGAVALELDRSLAAMAVAGLLVGFGTRLGNGCTSGHGVCGISRFSKRSLVATAVFMASGAATAFVVTERFGGSL